MGGAMSYEVNFDGLIGPTHNYSGLSYGNVASQINQNMPSNPKEAALQGLNKMKFLADIGMKQALLPPHERPHVPSLKALGFHGSPAEIIARAHKEAPELFMAICSAAAMWTANAATVSPSADTLDGRVHFTAANLTSKFHRSLEAQATASVLKKIFGEEAYFAHHPPLPQSGYFADEGAANHCRFCRNYEEAGIELFVYGRHSFKANALAPSHFPARQTYEASEAIARIHGLSKERTLFVQQNPVAIDAGAFHNDVVAVANKNLILLHEEAFIGQKGVIETLQRLTEEWCTVPLCCIEVPSRSISLKTAVETYLFNSQVISTENGAMSLIAPIECKENADVRQYIEDLAAHPKIPISSIHYVDLRQSMRNGGGPACLRLRVALTEEELKVARQGVFLDDSLYASLTAWIHKHYRDRLTPRDLHDKSLHQESEAALDELTQLLQLGSIYSFQL